MSKKINSLLFGILLAGLLFGAKPALAQYTEGLIISELLVHNESNYVDDYGAHNSWIEIMNSSYTNVNVGGCYLTDDLSNPKKYWIPTGFPETALAPREFIVFYGDAHATRGILHVNFKLQDGGIVALFAPNGSTLLDMVKIPAGQEVDKSYARQGKLVPTDWKLNKGSKWELKNPLTGEMEAKERAGEWAISEYTTPKSDNDYQPKLTSGDEFVKLDPYGAGMAIIAMFVVFTALIVLACVFKAIGKAFTREKKPAATGDSTAAAPVKKSEISGEVNAAIAAAIYLYQNEQHDYESAVLTVKKITRQFSPWNLRSSNMPHLPERTRSTRK
ncbi:MAG: OadG family protein [Bacteroidales bacterium]|jgi:sodium pump decarboxylase gamma subunit|nr:OadG family protein [Bacteroidales bacterium]